MECIEARALKSRFLSKVIGMKKIQQASIEDFWCVAGINTVVNVSSDEFSIDDLLNLPDKDFTNPDADTFEESEEDFSSVSSQDNETASMFSSTADLVSLTPDHLPLPIDDMENLEWLSQIVDDSVPELPILCPLLNRFEPVLDVSSRSFTVLGLPYPVPKKCRTDRSRKAGRVWSAGSLTESSSSSSSLSSSHDSSITSPILLRIPFYSMEVFQKQPAAKKPRKSPAHQLGLGSSDSLSQRRCTHCQVQKTPQWRTGPLGPKTLCNACGVRFKSGRLFPEYRPACSPTFSGDIHSNSHRKVLELRKKEKEIELVLNMTVQ